VRPWDARTVFRIPDELPKKHSGKKHPTRSVPW
jgi:hypothetical protein